MVEAYAGQCLEDHHNILNSVIIKNDPSFHYILTLYVFCLDLYGVRGIYLNILIINFITIQFSYKRRDNRNMYFLS